MSIALNQRILELERTVAAQGELINRTLKVIETQLARIEALEARRKTLTVPKNV